MIIGFTGTQNGMTDPQKKQVEKSLRLMYSYGSIFIHGDCIGADAEAHEIALRLGYRVWIYPGNIGAKRAYCKGAELIVHPQNPLERNRAIAHMCDKLIATPSTKTEIVRSGTWATVRYARKEHKPRVIIDPLGDTVYEMD